MFNSIITHAYSADVQGGLESAKNTLLQTGKSILDIVASVGFFVCVAVALFNLLMFLRVNRDGGTHGHEGRNMAITIAVAILCGAWTVWGGAFLA